MLRCAGPIPHHRLPATNGTRGLRGPGFIPAVADCRYRAPLSPRLVRPCPTPTGIRQTLVPMIQHFPGRCKNFRAKIFARFGKKGFTFLELLVYYCVVQNIRACSSVGRAFGSHPRGQGFKSLQVHHTPCPKHEKQQPSVPEGCCFLIVKNRSIPALRERSGKDKSHRQRRGECSWSVASPACPAPSHTVPR